MKTTTEVACPHCEAPMECEYEMGQGESYTNMGLSCWSYWFLAWIDLPEKCPDGCELSDDDRAQLRDRAEKDLLEGDHGR